MGSWPAAIWIDRTTDSAAKIAIDAAAILVVVRKSRARRLFRMVGSSPGPVRST
jgi:hypothetical protein